jgi:hypothetical protein
MTATDLVEHLRDRNDALLASVQERLRGDEAARRIARQLGLSEGMLVGQVVDFWLEAIRSDLASGSTTTLESSLQSLSSLRAGLGLRFDKAVVSRLFGAISDAIDAGLDNAAWRDEYATYRGKVEALIAAEFPK